MQAVDGVSFDGGRGARRSGIVGESGCGKSVTALSIMGLIPKPPAKIVDGLGPLRRAGPDDARRARSSRTSGARQIAMIFQDPMTSLNPTFKIGTQITETLRRHFDISKEDAPPAGGRAPRGGRDPARRRAARRLPAPVLGRHAPARDDRDRALVQPAAPDRGRADDRARRDHPGADPRPARAAPHGARRWR